MTVAFSQAFKDALVTRYTPHCVGWVRATASLWGHADDHDLDEPVRLSEEAPVRIRYQDWGENRNIVIDRKLSLKTTRTGHHAAMRFYFKDGKFLELEIDGISNISVDAKTIEVKPC